MSKLHNHIGGGGISHYVAATPITIKATVERSSVTFQPDIVTRYFRK